MKHDEHYFAKRGYSIVFSYRNRRQYGQSYNVLVVEYVNLVLWSIADRIVHIEHYCKCIILQATWSCTLFSLLCCALPWPPTSTLGWVCWMATPSQEMLCFFHFSLFCIAWFTCLWWFVPKILCFALWFFGGLNVMKIMAAFLRLIDSGGQS